MNLSITRGALVFFIIISMISYSLYVSIFPEKLKNFEFDNQTIWTINTKIRSVYSYITWKTTEIWDKSKELYDKNIDPTINNAKSKIENTVTETKWKIDNVRKTLSWAEQTIDKAWKVLEKWQETVKEATEVFNDVQRMNDAVIWTVNEDVVQ